jgi:hypothetical protein
LSSRTTTAALVWRAASAGNVLRNCRVGRKDGLSRRRRRRKIVVARIEGRNSERANIIDLCVLARNQHALASAVVGNIQLDLAPKHWDAVFVESRTFNEPSWQ